MTLVLCRRDQNGLEGLPRVRAHNRLQSLEDAAKALPLLQQAAELGESDALAYLGAAFMEGWAVARDEAKAVAYLRLAARRDHADALNDLAAALASGTGTNVDKAQAAKLFKRAAERGHSRAAANLAALSQ